MNLHARLAPQPPPSAQRDSWGGGRKPNLPGQFDRVSRESPDGKATGGFSRLARR